MVFVIQSIVLCALFTFAVLKSMKDPIKEIMSFPPAIRKRVESLPQYQGIIAQEKKQNMGMKFLAVPVFALVLAGACWLGGARTFLDAFLYGFALFLVVNLWDLIVLDWLWFCRSPKVRIPGTEDMDKEYRDPWFHLRGFFVGESIGVVISLLAAGVVTFAGSL